ncbi:MAG: septation protein IspZ, partial [Litoricolaceae bacterium]|nr:septation protein IspZ [Litorivicinaceae bacterium]
MKLLLDFLPILIFFGVYKTTGDLITATAVLIPVTIVQVAVVYWLT